MAQSKIALFGAAEGGEYKKAYLFESLEQLLGTMGNPPPESQGLFYAVQSLLFNHPVIYFRVKEEGFASADYLTGLRYLSSEESITDLAAICMPGVGDAEIIEATAPICQARKTLLVLTEADLFDYLTS